MQIIYVVIAVLAGWVIGFIDSNIRTAKKIKAAEANAEIKIKEAEKKIAQADQQISLESRIAPGLADDPGLLRLKNDNGRITIEMDGVLIKDSLPLDKKKRLIELVSNFRPYLETGIPLQTSSQPAAPLHASPEPASVQLKVPQPDQPAAKKPEPENKISTLSMVSQIDSILQKRLMTSPLAKSGIRLQESAQGGVEVYVGLNKYQTVDDVPDEIIKAEIRAAIAEWEQKFTPGY